MSRSDTVDEVRLDTAPSRLDDNRCRDVCLTGGFFLYVLLPLLPFAAGREMAGRGVMAFGPSLPEAEAAWRAVVLVLVLVLVSDTNADTAPLGLFRRRER